MTQMFLKILNMSISACWLVLAVLILRLVLRKAPRWINVLCWGIVAVRLICPFSIESALSLIPSAEIISEEVMSGPGFDVQTGIAPVDNRINDYLGDRYFEDVTVPASNGVPVMAVLSAIWGIGMLLLAAYTTISYWHLHHRLETAVLYKDNIFQSENVSFPFVLGMIKPRIYLPFKVDDQNLRYIIAHEQAHIRRRDHWWKLFGFLLLTIHWFNPLMWLAYVLLCRDIELACDEKVIKELGGEQRADYARVLVECSVSNRRIAACPLAFGEVGVKTRVKSVMNYRKPAFWIVILAVIACVAVAVCFLTNPDSKITVVMGANYGIEKILYAVTVGGEASAEPPLQYCVTADYHLYDQQTEDGGWNYLGALSPYALTEDELYRYMPVDVLRKDVKVGQVTDAYILRVENDNFYLVFQTKSGDTYLAYGWEDASGQGQDGVDDTTRLRRLYLLNSSFHSGYFNANFFEHSLTHIADGNVYAFAYFESNKIPGYAIVGFRSGDSSNHDEMADMGFAVFQTTGEGYRLINSRVYADAALAENGIYFCEDPAVADINVEMRNDNTFDVTLILNEDVDKVERVYSAEGKENLVQADTNINAPGMSVWSWDNSEGYTAVSQYFYDKDGNRIPADSNIPLNSASWKDLPNRADGAAEK